jgi:glutathione S-transferase
VLEVEGLFPSLPQHTHPSTNEIIMKTLILSCPSKQALLVAAIFSLLMLASDILAFSLSASHGSFQNMAYATGQARRHPVSRPTALFMSKTETLTLYGHPGTRSPLVNWAALELGVDLTVSSDFSKNPHPFGQLPCLTDAGNVVVFESGAILQYLHQCYSESMKLTREQSAAITSWIVWANASLDPICFLERPDGRVYDTGLREPNRRIDRLNAILSEQNYLVQGSDNTTNGDDGSIFTLADVATVSYLAYVLQFFPDVTISDKWPSIASYMMKCIARPRYGQAFGSDVQSRLLSMLKKDLAANDSGDSSTVSKKLFGMF